MKAVVTVLVLCMSLYGYDGVRHHENLYRSLTAWGGVSVAAGTGMLFADDDMVQAQGFQHLLWGAVNTGIAVIGFRKTVPSVENMHPNDARARLRRLMVINGIIDVAYIGTGVALIAAGKDNEVLRGHGIGITIQGGFLFGFDWINFGFTYRP